MERRTARRRGPSSIVVCDFDPVHRTWSDRSRLGARGLHLSPMEHGDFEFYITCARCRCYFCVASWQVELRPGQFGAFAGVGRADLVPSRSRCPSCGALILITPETWNAMKATPARDFGELVPHGGRLSI
jgi:hypothetical protein